MFLFIDWQPSIEAFHIGSFGVRWYSLCWVIGLLGAYLIVRQLYADQRIDPEIRKGKKVYTQRFDPLFLYCFIGVILGARLGHCLFYEPSYYLCSAKHIIEMFLPIRFDPGSWDWRVIGYTGLASHGGATGLFIGLLLYMRSKKVPFWVLMDNIGIAAPFTSFCIRIGNLMNSEIIGTTTDQPWGFIFHTNEALENGQLVARHPSQLYEAIAYLIIFIIIVLIYRQSRKAYQGKENKLYQVREWISVGTGFYFGLCLASIFLFRFFIEFLKEVQGGADDGSTLLDMGQILSIPFILIGLWSMFRKFQIFKKSHS